MFGIEMEHAIFGFDETKCPVPQEQVVDLFMRNARRMLKDRSLPFRGSHGGLMLDNGARLYADETRQRNGELRAAIEFATPEETDPVRAVASCRWGQRLLLSIATEIEQRRGVTIELYGPGVCPISRNSTGCHMSFFRFDSRIPVQLSSHLASLIAITGTGGLSGLTFVRSARAELISRAVSSSSCGANRGLIDNYNVRPHSSVGVRYQDINCDAGSDIQLIIRLGSTALLLALLDDGLLNLDDLQFVDPVAALRSFNRSPESKQPLTSGRELNGFEIQHTLIKRVSHLAGFVTHIPWVTDFLSLWSLLTKTAADQKALSRDNVFDFSIHQLCLEKICRSEGVSLTLLSRLNPIYARLSEIGMIDHKGLGRLSVLLRRWRSWRNTIKIVDELDQFGIDWDGLRKIIDRLLPELRTCSLAFARIGPQGLKAKLEAAGVIDSCRVPERLINDAGANSPATRARIRGQFVRQTAGKLGLFAANWSELFKENGESIPLPSPFLTCLENDLTADNSEVSPQLGASQVS